MTTVRTALPKATLSALPAMMKVAADDDDDGEYDFEVQKN